MYRDLFGDTITTPRTASPKGLLNAAHGFPEFWAAWPSNTRKVAKQQCLDKWARLGCSEAATHIVQHVEFMKKQEDWLKQNGAFICAPLVYLNQQRWVDWEAPVEAPAAPSALDKIKADALKAAPMPASVREKLAALKKGR